MHAGYTGKDKFAHLHDFLPQWRLQYVSFPHFPLSLPLLHLFLPQFTSSHDVDALSVTFFAISPGKPSNLYSYAIPGQKITNGIHPSQVVTSLYKISIEDPTIIGVTNGNTMLVLSCRDSNCADYNQATYKTLVNSTFGRSIATTLTKDSSLSILYTKTKPSGGYDLMLDICKDPVCALKNPASVHVDTLLSDVEVWLGYDVNTGLPLIVVSDNHLQQIRSYKCDGGVASMTCTVQTTPLVNEATNSFSIQPYQTDPTKKPKAPLTTHSFVLTYATHSPANNKSEVIALNCASDLSSCTPSTLNVIGNETLPIYSVSHFVTGPTSYSLGYATLNKTSATAVVYLAECTLGSKCTPVSSGPYTLGFVPDHDNLFELDVQVLNSGDSGISVLSQASNGWVASDQPPASNLYGLTKTGIFAVVPKKYEVAKYHKNPPSVLVGIIVVAGVAVLSTILVIGWRIWVGQPVKPGYTHIN